MKQNDWILAGLANPEMSVGDFVLSGLNTDNTQLLSKENYKKSQLIREQFSENGKFNENKFNDFYNNRVSEFDKFQALNFEDTFMYDPFDPRSTEKNVKDINFQLTPVANPTRQTITLTGDIYESNTSERERAQGNYIWDFEKQEWSDETLNDRALFKSPLKWLQDRFVEPLVYATYDEDGEHEDLYTGKIVKHHKGEYKLNQYGLPYVETLNGRSTIGKEVVSAFDTLTSEHQAINKYDFFDSDDLDKSVTGTIVKTAITVAPLLIGGPVSAIYSGIYTAKELARIFPSLYGYVSSWFTDDENEFINTLGGIGAGFTQSTSDYAKLNIISFENAANLIADIALQWGAQKNIALSISKLRGSKKLQEGAYLQANLQYEATKENLKKLLEKGIITKEAFEKYVGGAWNESVVGKKAIEYFSKQIEPLIKKSNNLGSSASLVYMALVSNSDVYESMLEAGASKKEAATVALGSTLGMFLFDKYTHLGELFFDDLTSATEHQIRRTFTKDAKSWYNNVIKLNVSDEMSKSTKFRRLLKSGMDFGKKQTSKFIDDLKYHTTGFLGKAVGEGLEEVGEEFISDLSKQLYELAHEIGINTTVTDVGAFDNLGQRYTLSFFGGALGGGLFHGIDILNNGKFSLNESENELIYLVRNGKTQETLKELEKWRKKGKLGSRNLSVNTTKDKEGNEVFLTVNDENESQNEFIYKRIKETILSLDNVINGYGADLSDGELYSKMVLSEGRFLELQDYLQDVSYTTKYQEDYLQAILNVINTKAALQRAEQTKSGNYPQTDEQLANDLINDEQLRNLSESEKKIRNANLKKIQDDLVLAEEHLQNFLSGKYSLEYTEKMLFALDKHLSNDFVIMSFEQWLNEHHYGKTPNNLSPEEYNKYKQEYFDYKKSNQKANLDLQFKLYKDIKSKINPHLLNISENQELFKTFHEKSKEIFDLELKQYSFDDILDFEGETEESDTYINRNLDSERVEKINNKNLELQSEYKNKVLSIIQEAGGFIDPVTNRQIKQNLNLRFKNQRNFYLLNFERFLINQNIKLDELGNIVSNPGLSELDDNILNILLNLNKNNFEEIRNQINVLLEDYAENQIKKHNCLVDNFLNYFSDFGIFNLFKNESGEYPEKLTGKEVLAYIKKELGNGKTIELIFDINSYNYYKSFGISKEQFIDLLNEIQYNYGTDNFEELVFLESISTFDIKNRRDDVERVLEEIADDPMIQLHTELENKLSETNPVIELIKLLGLSINKDTKNIEKLLSDLDKRIENSDEEFILNSTEKESLFEAIELIKLALSYLYASAVIPNTLAPFGHNNFLNDMKKKHSELYSDLEDFAILSKETYTLYNEALTKYLILIGIENKETGTYNPGSLLWLSNQSEINQAEKLIKAEKALYKTIYDLFDNHEIFKFTYDGKEYDLLEGFEEIPKIDLNSKDALLHINKLSSLFYTKIQELIKNGWTYEDIWSRSQILQKLTNFNNILLQKTCPIDENLNIDRLTDYDKIIYLLTMGAIDSNEFYSYLNTRIKEENNIVPLTIQEWISRIGISLVKNSQIFYDTLNYIKIETKDNRPILFGTYIRGNGGSGKTRVCGRNIANYISSNNIWLSTPAETLMNTLLESTSKGITMLNRSNLDSSENLLLRIGVNKDKYDSVMNALNKEESHPLITIEKTSETNLIHLNPEDFGIKKVSNPPDMIIIDEVTYLSNFELLLISEFCKLNNIPLIFIGDDKQLGFINTGRNIDRENCIIVRTPDLNISLRSNNILHHYNLNVVGNLINELNNSDENDPNYQMKIIGVKNATKNINLKVYNNDDINGDLITSELTQEDINKLNGTIAYVGDDKSLTYKTLKDSGKEFVSLKPSEIQGQEFDYVIINKDFDTDFSSEIKLLSFLQDLYTMISRSKLGSIIVNNTLQNVIGKNQIEYIKGQVPSIVNYIDRFKSEKLELLEKLLNNTSKSVNTPSIFKLTTPSKPIFLHDEDFHSKNLDYDNNYYVIKLINFSYGDVPDTLPMDDEMLLVGKDQIDQIIELQKSGKGYNGFILLEFSKTNFSDIKKVSDIKDKLGNNEFVSYIKYIVNVLPDKSVTEEPVIEEPPVDVLPPKEEPEYKEELFVSDILCYGNATFTGMSVRIENGKEVWINDSGIKRDAALFTDEVEVTDNQLNISKLIKAFKNNFLYKNNYANLSDEIKEVISENEYNNISWNIEIRNKNQYDHLIRNIGMSNDKLNFRDNLLITVVGKFKNKKGEDAYITLGLLGKPESWKNHIQELLNEREILRKKSKRSSKENIRFNYINNYLDKIKYGNKDEYLVDKYSTYIDKIIELYNNSKNESLLIPIKLRFTGMTDLYNSENVRVSNYYKAIVDSLIEYKKKYLNIINSNEPGLYYQKIHAEHKITQIDKQIKHFTELIQSEKSFKLKNPYTIVSPMYIYTPNNLSKEKFNIDKSVIGAHNVIFVSNDPSITNKEDLIKIYMLQKNNPTENLPKVRMVVLNNVGVSFADLSNPYLMGVMYNETSHIDNKGQIINSENIYPFKTHYTGVRMYVAMWNFRANLLQFEENLNKLFIELEKYGVDKTNIDEYLIYKDLKWRSENGRTLTGQESEYLSTFDQHQNINNINEINKLIDEFNNNLQIRLFRLGSDFYNGVYIRKLEGNQFKSLYKSDNINGIYLNYNTFDKYLTIINSIFENIIDEIVKVEDSTNKKILLTTKEGVKNSFSGSIHKIIQTNGEIEILDGTTIKFESGYDPNNSNGILNSFSHLPAVLSKAYKFINMLNADISNELNNGIQVIKILSTIDKDGKKVPVDKIINYQQVLKDYLSRNPTKVVEIFDRTFSDLFSLLFHGTLLDIHDKNVQKSSDALFPKGFFSDPLSTSEIVFDENGKTFIKAILNDWYYEADVNVQDPTFYIVFDNLEEKINKENIKKVDSFEYELFIKEYVIKYNLDEDECLILLTYKKFKSLASDDEKMLYLKDMLNDKVETIIKNNIDFIFNKPDKLTMDHLDLYISLDKTFKQLIDELCVILFGGIVEIKSINRNKDKVLIETNLGNLELELDRNNDITFTKKGSEIADNNQPINYKEMLNQFKSELINFIESNIDINNPKYESIKQTLTHYNNNKPNSYNNLLKVFERFQNLPRKEYIVKLIKSFNEVMESEDIKVELENFHTLFNGIKDKFNNPESLDKSIINLKENKLNIGNC